MANLWFIISCGEIFAVSYELALRTVLFIKEKRYPFIPVLVGSNLWLDLIRKKYNLSVSSLIVSKELINNIRYITLPKEKYLLINVDNSSKKSISYVKNNAATIVYDTLSITAQIVKGLIDANEKFAIVTMPVAKHTVNNVYPKFVGHTEYFAEKFGVKKETVAMLMEAKDLEGVTYNVLLLTRHVSLKDVHKKLSPKDIFRQTENVVKFINKYEKEEIKKVIFSNVNPHGGDEGRIGFEERNIIFKSMKNIKEKLKIEVDFVTNIADAFKYVKENKQKVLIAASYHDQAMIPLKLLCGYNIVNITVGLPFIRVSPGHGTASELLFKKNADFSGVKLCVEKICEFFGI